MNQQSSASDDTAAIGPEIALVSGVVRGIDRDENGVLAFRGIPYAAPPVGARRWRPPMPSAPWTGALDATEFGSGTPTLMPQGDKQSEDCLYLNVWTPARSTGAGLPVMIWIPGGGFQESNAARVNVHGDRLAARDVVVVSFNYRTGVFGFLAHPALDAEGAPSGNFGLQDQLAALRWVRANIACFGGDPDNVTIFGESAGAASVALLMGSPEGAGLFHRAIGQSGGFWESIHGSTPTREEAQLRGRQLWEDLGVTTPGEARALSTQDVLKLGGWRPPSDPLLHGFTPSIDGYIVPDNPARIYAAGNQHDVPLLAGWNAEEGATFAAFNRMFAGAEEFREALDTWLAPRADEGTRVYPTGTHEEATSSRTAIAGDTYVIEQTWAWLQHHSRTGTAPVFGYHFAVHTDYTPVAMHAVDIDYVLGTLQPHWLSAPSGTPGARDRVVADQMMSYWANFARSGDPNGPGLPVWPVYTPADSQVMTFGDTETKTTPEPGTDRYRYLDSLRGPDLRRPASWRGDTVAP